LWDEIEVIHIDNFCNKCGTKIRPHANFCEGCGQKIQTQDEMKAQLIKEIEQEIKTKTRNELLAEIQVAEKRTHQLQTEKQQELNQKKSTDDIIIYKKGDWVYVTATIVFLVIFLIFIFVVL
jgi:hypothetical protein